jgi:hypothetical protein
VVVTVKQRRAHDELTPVGTGRPIQNEERDTREERPRASGFLAADDDGMTPI